MPEREYSAGSQYRYGFNGQEMDNDIIGLKGTLNTAEFWEYDTRLGRRWNVDPLWYDWQSPYSCFNNNPVYYNDPYGLEGQDNNLGAPTKNNADLPSDKNKVMRVPESEVEKVKNQCFERTEASGHYTVNYYHVPDAPVKDGPRYKGSYDAKGNWTLEKDAYGQPIPATEGAYYAVWTWNSKGNSSTPNINPAGNSDVKASNPTVGGNPANTVPAPALNNAPPPQNIRPPLPNPVNFNAGSPFRPNSQLFSNQLQTTNILRQATNTFNNGGRSTTVIVSTNLPRGDVGPDGTGIDNLLWQRARATRRALLNLGMPANAFGRNWVQFRYNTSPNLQIIVR